MNGRQRQRRRAANNKNALHLGRLGRLGPKDLSKVQSHKGLYTVLIYTEPCAFSPYLAIVFTAFVSLIQSVLHLAKSFLRRKDFRGKLVPYIIVDGWLKAVYIHLRSFKTTAFSSRCRSVGDCSVGVDS